MSVEMTVDAERAWFQVEKREGTFHYQFWVLEYGQTLSYVKSSQLVDKAGTSITGGFVTETALRDIKGMGRQQVEIVGWVPSRTGNIVERADGDYYTFYYHVVRGASKALFDRGSDLRNQANDDVIANGIVIEMSYESDPESYWDVITVQGWVPYDKWYKRDLPDGTYYMQTYRLARDASLTNYLRGAQLLKDGDGADITDGIILKMDVEYEADWAIVTIQGRVPRWR